MCLPSVFFQLLRLFILVHPGESAFSQLFPFEPGQYIQGVQRCLCWKFQDAGKCLLSYTRMKTKWHQSPVVLTL